MNLKKLWVLNDFVICLVIRLPIRFLGYFDLISLFFCLFVCFIYKLLVFFFFFFFGFLDLLNDELDVLF